MLRSPGPQSESLEICGEVDTEQRAGEYSLLTYNSPYTYYLLNVRLAQLTTCRAVHLLVTTYYLLPTNGLMDYLLLTTDYLLLLATYY